SASIKIGDSAHDTSTLSGATTNAGGTVTYTLYTDLACSAGAISLGTKTVQNGIVLDSDSHQFNSAGTFYFQAVYSGDANNNGATSVCTDEQIVVAQNDPKAHSMPVVQIKDTFNVTGLTSDATGSVVVGLYTSSDCTTGHVGSDETFAAN